MRFFVAERAGDLPMAHADLGALVEVLVELVALGTQGEIFPDVLFDLRHGGVVFIELVSDELKASALGRTVDPGEVRRGAAIQPDAGADDGVAIIGQFGRMNDVRRNESPGSIFQAIPLPTDAELHRLRFIVVGLQFFVIRHRECMDQILAVGVMTVRGSSLDLDFIPTGMWHGAEAAEEELAIEDQLRVPLAVAEMDVGRAFRVLRTDDAEPVGGIEPRHLLGAVLPFFDRRFAIHLGEIVSVIEHRIGGLQILLQMMPRSTQDRADVAKSFQFLIAGKAGRGIELARESKEVLNRMEILDTTETTMHHSPAPGLRGRLRQSELFLDPHEQCPALFIGRLLLLGRRHLAKLELMQHLLPTLRDGDVRADG